MDNIRVKITDHIWLPKICGIYVIKCLRNGKIYIGQAKDICEKIENYIKKIKNKSIDIRYMKGLKEDLLKFGQDAFVIDVIAFCAYDNLNFLERYFIKKYKSIEFGYNTINGKRTINTTKYKFDLGIMEARKENTLNNIISKYRKACNGNEDYIYLITIENLQNVLNIEDSFFNDFIEFLTRMDFEVYNYNYNYNYGECYKINSLEIRYLRTINAEKSYIKCSYLQNAREYLILESDFIKNTKYIDKTYDRYKKIENLVIIKK